MVLRRDEPSTPPAHSANGVRPGATAFESAVLPHLDAAYNLARYLMPTRADAEDAVQEACLRALRYFATFRGENPRAWLLAIVRNTCHTLRRRSLSSALTVGLDDEPSRVELWAPDTAVGFERNEERLRLRRAIDALPAEFREALVLRELEGCSYKEIGRITGVPIGTVTSRLARARTRLQRLLKPTPDRRH
ncbi:MAG TPA: sigma-70 family RNA polymerase sigma factor [Gemmatimonadaceae bacterium]|nr:sigma-70 family RNA polymerase sigma factor [Gemmatimonadaceae bacterium]